MKEKWLLYVLYPLNFNVEWFNMMSTSTKTHGRHSSRKFGTVFMSWKINEISLYCFYTTETFLFFLGCSISTLALNSFFHLKKLIHFYVFNCGHTCNSNRDAIMQCYSTDLFFNFYIFNCEEIKKNYVKYLRMIKDVLFP